MSSTVHNILGMLVGKFLLILIKLYSPFWALACNTVFLHPWRSLTIASLLLYSHHIYSPLKPRLSIFGVVFLFSSFLPL